MPRRPRSPYDSAWRRLARLVRLQAGGRCEFVDEDGVRCSEPATEVDHLIPVSEAPELRLVRSNLRAACRRHNVGRTTGRQGRLTKVDKRIPPMREW